MHTAMVISPHADDAAAFCGGTLAKLARQGWRVLLVRVTDDRKDSVGLTLEETIRRNRLELEAAAAHLGVAGIIDLGFETDCLADVPEVALRERFVHLFRAHRPYAVFSFDPFDRYENNQDHLRVAQAVDEAYWVATFDLHHPGHFTEGLEPFAVCERWYFGRNLPDPNHAEDVSETMEAKILALCAQRTMMRNLLHQHILQLRTWGRRVPWLEQSMEGDPRPLIASFLQEQANAVARAFGLPEGHMAEAFRRVRFGDLEGLFQELSEPIDGAEPPPVREGLDRAPAAASGPEWGGESVYPADLTGRIRLMGHHHLCVGAFDELLGHPAFQHAYAGLIERITPSPDLIVESIFGYDIFCYQCGYWSPQDGRCSTGWQNKISKDRAVLEHLGLRTGESRRLEDLQRLLAERVGPEQLERFCGPGEWKCEFYLLGACQAGYAGLRRRSAIDGPSG